MTFLLKHPRYLAILVALAAVLVWHLSTWGKASKRSKENQELRGRIESASGQPADGGTRTGLAPAREWRQVAARMVDLGDREDLSDLPEWLDLLEDISEMSTRELIDALEEIPGKGLNAEARELLEEHLTSALIAKDPQLALTHLADRIGDEEGGVAWQLPSALGAWARQYPGAAAAWMDQQIAAGRFESTTLDGSSGVRIEFEAELIEVLLTEDPASASARVSALPEDQRQIALEQVDLTALSAAGQVSYAELMRQSVPPDEDGALFSQAVSELLMDGGLDKVAEFMDRIGASPEERASSSKQAAGHHLGEIATERVVSLDDLNSLRQWLGGQVAGPAERIAGEALAEASQWGEEFTVRDALNLAIEFHQSGGSADLPLALIAELAPDRDQEDASSLLQRLADPEERARFAAEIE